LSSPQYASLFYNFRWDHEQHSRQEAEDKAEQLRKQLDFQAQINSKVGILIGNTLLLIWKN
jgi:hypothetical protein